MQKARPDLQTTLTDELIDLRVRGGEWPNKTIVGLARDQASRYPDRVALHEGDIHLTNGQIWRLANKLAASLKARGVKAGDIVAMQLPNWAETSIIYLAAGLTGAILNPILPILRDKEVSFMLRDSGARVLFIPERFRNFSYVDMIDRIRDDLPKLESVVILRGEAGKHSAWDALIDVDLPLPLWPESDPNDVKIVMYTSGTTGRPKGVMHTHNTLQAEILTYLTSWELGADDVIFMASPVSHITGCLLAFELPWASNSPVVLQEKWDAGQAIDLFLKYGVTFTSSSTPFLRELLDAAKARNEHLLGFKRFVCGGMAIPPQLILDAHEWFRNATIGRCCGMTEVPAITIAIKSREQIALGAGTDGILSPGTEVRICDPKTGVQLPPGVEGEIIARAPEQFVGYFRPEDNQGAFTEDGFFLTGDIGILSAENCLSITGRKKDLIIRGGENISAREIEDALSEHEAIAEVAVVAMPHERLGEGVACFIVLKEGRSIDQSEVARYLNSLSIARQKIPERVEIAAELPRNIQGKVLKNILRDRMRELCAA